MSMDLKEALILAAMVLVFLAMIGFADRINAVDEQSDEPQVIEEDELE